MDTHYVAECKQKYARRTPLERGIAGWRGSLGRWQ
jgi:hypothetical protein